MASTFYPDETNSILFDFKTGKPFTVVKGQAGDTILLQDNWDWMVNLEDSYQSKTSMTFTPLTSDCTSVDLRVVIQSTKKPSQCGTKGSPHDNTAFYNQLCQKLVSKELCQKDFEEKEWNQVTSLPKGDTLSEDQALLWLYRFQKPKGLDLKKHFSILHAILVSPLVQSHPELINGALDSVLVHSPENFKMLHFRYPHLLDVPIRKQTLSCVSKREAKEIEDAKKSAKGTLLDVERWAREREDDRRTPSYLKEPAVRRNR